MPRMARLPQVQAHEAPCLMCAREPAHCQEERKHSDDVKCDGAEIGRQDGWQVIGGGSRQVQVIRRDRVDWLGRQQHLERHDCRIKQGTVRGAWRASQQGVAIWEAPALPQALRAQVHEPSRIVGRASQGDSDIDDEECDRERRQHLDRDIRNPPCDVGQPHPADRSNAHSEAHGDFRDEHPVEKVEVARRTKVSEEPHRVEEQGARGEHQQQVDVSRGRRPTKIETDDQNDGQSHGDSESLRR